MVWDYITYFCGVSFCDGSFCSRSPFVTGTFSDGTFCDGSFSDGPLYRCIARTDAIQHLRHGRNA